ncbi:hypothetical protein [Roseiflexus castenholzii]|uniref:Uncharacterized protein n=1 Tax=Roseiflexus castenholzii (strain DSM 13941 / HLO8) TaxID=383372 RepID=A7NPK5_ROSCS|nr:hypothetical protein [Roseiflexus castenholzii]ABU59501.1 hypothetical protein Rcas_3451 [Roseiflexus castenholzii DSM 13941]
MVRLILQRNRLTLLTFVVIPAAIAAIAAAWLLRPQATSGSPLGDPNAPVVAATPAPFVGGQPPIARPAAVPVAASRADGGPPPDAPANFIEARMPDARYHDAAFAAVQCAVGRPLTRDPALDALAVEAWRAKMMYGHERVEAMNWHRHNRLFTFAMSSPQTGRLSPRTFSRVIIAVTPTRSSAQ